ncbi:hypothetical protein KAH81_00600 [bacterium]|nr:hypothetical protein [bacterium]
MFSRRVFFFAIFALLFVFSAVAMPHIIQYQGKLTDLSGVGYNDTLDMSFRIFNAPTTGAALWTENHHAPGNDVPIVKGLFDVALGSAGTPINLDFHEDYWLEITVDGNILLPRVKLDTSPYAFRAAIADSVVGGAAGDTAFWEIGFNLINPKNNDDVQINDDGDNLLGDIYVNMDHAANGSDGIYVYRDGLYYGPDVANIHAYRTGASDIDNGGTSWNYGDVDAAIKGYTLWGNKYVAAIAGYNWFDYDTSAAVLGGDYDGSSFGALGYSCDGNIYSGYFFGEAVHIHPISEPLWPVEGDIYTNDADHNLYYYDGTSWVDLTAVGGPGTSQWTDHATDPYIYANNNAGVQAFDAGEDTVLIVNAFGTYAGTAIRGLGDYGPADTCLGYLGFGGTLVGHPEGWRGAGVYGYSEASVDAIYGFAADGGNGVLGVAQGWNDELWRFGGVRGYNADSLTDGRLGTWHYGGEFTKGLLLNPETTNPWVSEGAIYANSTDHNLYYYDGTSWVDLTATGGGADADWTIGSGIIYNTTDDVAIGTATASASAKLTVQGGDIQLESDNDFIDINDSGTSLTGYRFYRSGSFQGGLFQGPELAYLSGSAINYTLAVDLANERVGIGTNTPSVKLDVNGDARITGDLEVTGEIDPIAVTYEPQAAAPPVAEGKLYYNDAANELRVYDGTTWQSLGGGGGGGGTVNFVPMWTPDGSTLGDSRIDQSATQIQIGGTGSMQSNLLVYCDETSDKNAIFGGNLNSDVTAGTAWNHDDFGAGVYGLNEINAAYRAGVVGLPYSVYGDHTAGVVGANSDGSVYGGLGYRMGGLDYAGYFVGDVSIDGNVGIGTTTPSHSLTISNTVDDNTLRLIGPDALGYGARLNFGDGDYAYIEEVTDDDLLIHASDTLILRGNDALRLYIDYSDGNTGQVLTSDGTYASWQNAPGGLSGTGLLNKLAIWSGTSALTYDNYLSYDAANDRLQFGSGEWFEDDGVFTIATNSDFVPNIDNTRDLGSATKEWADLYIDGTAYLDAIELGGVTRTTWPVEGLWTDNGTYISANNATNVRIYDNIGTGLIYISGTESSAITNWSNDGSSIKHCYNAGTSLYGVNVSASSANTDYGIYASGDEYAGYFAGKVEINNSTQQYSLEVNNTKASSFNRAIHGESDANYDFQYGVYGRANTPGSASNYYAYGVYGYADVNDGAASTDDAWGVRGSAYADDVAYGVYGYAFSGATTYYGVYYSGGLGGTGTKSAIVRTEDGPKTVYCQESPGNWFEDFGSGVISGGHVHIEIAADYLQTVTVNEEHPMKIFIQMENTSIDYKLIKNQTGFDIEVIGSATGDVAFDYRVAAKRRGYEDLRLKPAPHSYSDNFLYPDLADVPQEWRVDWIKNVPDDKWESEWFNLLTPEQLATFDWYFEQKDEKKPAEPVQEPVSKNNIAK